VFLLNLVHVDMLVIYMVLMPLLNEVVVNAVVQLPFGHVLNLNVMQHVQHQVILIIQPLMDFVIHIKAIVNMF
jgi:hypothetical protein